MARALPILLVLAASCAAPADGDLDAIALRLRGGGPWETPREREQAVIHFCGNARPGDADVLYELIRTEPDRTAYFAVLALGVLADDAVLEGVEGDLPFADARLTARLLSLLAASPHGRAAKIAAEQAAGFLGHGEQSVVRAALSALGAHRVWTEVPKILDLFVRTEDSRLLNPLARALGRMCEVRLGETPTGEREVARLKAFLFLYRLSISPTATPETCGALLRVMTRQELEKFLSDFADEDFASRDLFIEVAGGSSCDPGKASMVRRVFLDSP
ncbi:MAG: hypothetical protein ACYTAF_04570 [Planctomycetota bacterium]|jgi:hypothetical protein